MHWLEVFEEVFHVFITITIHGLELMGVVVVVCGAISAFYGYFVRHAPNIRLSLAQSMALGLEFKLGGEILRTVIARDWNEILTVGAIILLRAALNFLIHWEINNIHHDSEIVARATHSDAHPGAPETHVHPGTAGLGGHTMPGNFFDSPAHTVKEKKAEEQNMANSSNH